MCAQHYSRGKSFEKNHVVRTIGTTKHCARTTGNIFSRVYVQALNEMMYAVLHAETEYYFSHLIISSFRHEPMPRNVSGKNDGKYTFRARAEMDRRDVRPSRFININPFALAGRTCNFATTRYRRRRFYYDNIVFFFIRASYQFFLQRRFALFRSRLIRFHLVSRNHRKNAIIVVDDERFARIKRISFQTFAQSIIIIIIRLALLVRKRLSEHFAFSQWYHIISERPKSKNV